MKKSLYITAALVLCAGVLLAGALLRGKPDDITPPDGTQDTTPDNTQNTTPPDSTADDNKTADDPTPPAQDDPTPPVQDDPTPPADPDPAPPTQDDNKDPVDNPIETDGTEPTEKPLPDYGTLSDLNTTALQNYYAFLTGEATAYNHFYDQDRSFADETRQGQANIWLFKLVDIGSDGVLEVYMMHEDNRYSDIILFYEDGKLYTDYIPNKGMGNMTHNGMARSNGGSGHVVYESFSATAKEGVQRLTVAQSRTTDGVNFKYYISATYENGKYTAAEECECTKDEFDALVKPIDDAPVMEWIAFTVGKVQQVFLSLK